VSTPVTINAFSVTSAANSKQLYSAQNVGFEATQNLPDGTLLGVADTISANSSWFVAKSDLAVNVTTIYSFPSTEFLPHTPIYANDGNCYGVSIELDGSGYVYRVTPAGVFTKLWSSPAGAFGGPPLYVPLLQAEDGNLYGAVTSALGNTKATFYKLTLDGPYTLLYTFPPGVNYQPTALIESSDGNFYGSTLGVGSKLFRLTKSGVYTELYTMNAIRDGQCLCQLTLGSDGIIYGTARGQGKYGCGGVFALDVGMPIPHPWALSATVTFNGVPVVDVSNSDPNYVWATVPAGATTGPVTIATPGRSNTTQAAFIVQSRSGENVPHQGSPCGRQAFHSAMQGV
jgi:hypothetical protein